MGTSKSSVEDDIKRCEQHKKDYSSAPEVKHNVTDTQKLRKYMGLDY
nr:hypothetical protein [Candidatus Mycoplasma haematolamae]